MRLVQNLMAHASRLVQADLLVGDKPDVLRPGIEGKRGSMVVSHDYGHVRYEYIPNTRPISIT